MIEKNRLEELIKQEDTIWVQNKYCGAYDVELNHLYHIEITDNKESLLYWDESIDEENTKEEILVDYLEYLYETKEDAEFASEFQNIQRVEILILPFWEDILNKKLHKIYFSSKIGGTFIMEIEENIFIYEVGCFPHFIFNKKTTKENYFEACKEARRLFSGGSK